MQRNDVEWARCRLTVSLTSSSGAKSSCRRFSAITNGNRRKLSDSDSLYRGYPVGTLLLWQSHDVVETRQAAFASSAQSALTTYPQLLLDGQQRLTSLLRVMRGEVDLLFNLEHPELSGRGTEGVDEESDGEEDRIADRCHLLSKQTFQIASAALRRSHSWISVKRVFDGVDLDFLLELKEHADDAATFSRWQRRIEALKKIPAYMFQIQTLPPSLSYEQIADIFVRVNSGGTRLGGTDLALAQVTARWPGSLKLFEGEVDELKKQHFVVDIGLLVRSIVVCATNSCKLQKISDVPLARLQRGWEQAQRGLRRAIQFIRDDALIDSSELLKSKNVFIPLMARFGVGRDEISDAERKAWVAWFYGAMMWGRYSSAAETKLDQDLAVLAEEHFEGVQAPMRLMETIRQQFGRLSVDPQDFDQRYSSSSRLFMLYAVAREREAVCWGTGISSRYQRSARSTTCRSTTSSRVPNCKACQAT